MDEEGSIEEDKKKAVAAKADKARAVGKPSPRNGP